MDYTEARKLWVEALRSGEYVQGTSALHTESEGKHAYCCLGVACQVYQQHVGGLEVGVDEGIFRYDHHASLPPAKVCNWLGINLWGEVKAEHFVSDAQAHCLTEMNDVAHYTFAQIADVIEKDGLLSTDDHNYKVAV